MQAIAYEGYFNNGRFYTSGKVVDIPEQQRVVITILGDVQNIEEDALSTWDDIKRMIAESAHENHLLTDDVFRRDNSSRDILNFENGEFAQ